LGAFWSRGNGAKDDTSGIETTQANNGRWRRRSRDGQASEAVDERRRSRRNRPTGALRVETSRGRRSTERYFYSASFVSTQCPSFPEETCEIDYGDDDEDHSSDANSGHWVKNPGRIVEGALTNFVHRHAIHTLNLRISSRSLNTTGAFPLLLRGDVGELDVSFDRLAFPSLKLSGGGTIRALGLTVNPCSFLPVTGRFARRFRDPFELQALGCVFTQEDIRNSSLLRDGLGMLLERIVKRLVAASNDLLEAAVAGVDDYVSVKVLEVDILDDSRMISCTGTIFTQAGAPDVPFEVRTELSASHLGHVLDFPGMEMVLNPGSALQVVVPLHLLHSVSLDIGENACLDTLIVDSRRKWIEVSMRAVVTPSEHGLPPKVLYRRRYGGVWAKYSCDVAKWITTVGRFSR